jgi:hypothetical protein
VGEFTGSYSDQIALLFIYLPLVRQEVYNYVELCNTHLIRFQRNRPELPHGKPVVLYFTPLPGVRNYGLHPPIEKLRELQGTVEEWGMIIFSITRHSSLNLTSNGLELDFIYQIPMNTSHGKLLSGVLQPCRK